MKTIVKHGSMWYDPDFHQIRQNIVVLKHSWCHITWKDMYDHRVCTYSKKKFLREFRPKHTFYTRPRILNNLSDHDLFIKKDLERANLLNMKAAVAVAVEIIAQYMLGALVIVSVAAASAVAIAALI